MFRPKWIKRKFRSSESLGSRKFEIGGPDFSGHTSMQVTSHYFDSSIGAVGPTAEHLSRHCAHRLSKVMPTDVFLTLHGPVRTTAMRTPSRFYKAPEKKADVAIDSPKWWASKSGTSKTAKNNIPSPNITSPSIIFGVFQSFPVIFLAFYQLHLFRWVELHPGFVQRHRWDSGGVRRGSLAILMGKMESHLVICWFNHGTMKKEGSN